MRADLDRVIGAVGDLTESIGKLHNGQQKNAAKIDDLLDVVVGPPTPGSNPDNPQRDLTKGLAGRKIEFSWKTWGGLVSLVAATIATIVGAAPN